MNIEKIRKDFPYLERRINESPLAYLDSAATSQKPLAVLQAMDDTYRNHCANVHRGVYSLSEEATALFENARETVRSFIRAQKTTEIIFTKSTTESINLAMRTYATQNIKKGDIIAVSVAEHHANFVPWQQLAFQKGAKLHVLELDENGQVMGEIPRKTKLLALAHVSNVLGSIQPIHEIVQKVHETGGIAVIDGAQAVPHMAVDVKKINADFYAFSSHKMLGPFGIGVLYGKEELLEKAEPFLYGGDMIREVSITKSTWNVLPYKFEAGTPPLVEAVGLGAAIQYLNKLGFDTIKKHEQELSQYAYEQLTSIKGIEVLSPAHKEHRTGVVTFDVKGIHPHDVAAILGEEGVCIRSGHHCAMPLHTYLKKGASNRASFYIYNTKEEIDRLVNCITKAQKIFKV